MNNYIFANLSNGKLSKSQAGGGKPVFTLGENNTTQIYFLDSPKPSTYPAQALGDGYSTYSNSINTNSQTLTIRAGTAIGSTILSDNTWSNLPTTITPTFTFTQRLDYILIANPVLSGEIVANIQPVPVGGSAVIQFDFAAWGGGQKISFLFDPNAPISFLRESLSNCAKLGTYGLVLVNNSAITSIIDKITQPDDFTYLYQFTAFQESGITSPAGIDYPSVTSTILSNTLYSAYGKYGELDFSSASWTTLLGTSNEKEIWIDVDLDGKTVAQGAAILRKKLT